MSQNSKIILGVLIIIIIGIIWWGMAGQSGAPAPVNQPPTSQNNPPATQNTPANSGLPASTDNSDVALTQDLSLIDSQMNKLNSDSASVDQGLNDKPIQVQ